MIEFVRSVRFELDMVCFSGQRSGIVGGVYFEARKPA
jgi:hypothetical protein